MGDARRRSHFDRRGGSPRGPDTRGAAAGAAAVDSPLRQLDMNVLRSSPVLPVACLLQSTMRCCCGVSVFAGAGSAAEARLHPNASATESASENFAFRSMMEILSKVDPDTAPGAGGAESTPRIRSGRSRARRGETAVGARSAVKRGGDHASLRRQRKRLDRDDRAFRIPFGDARKIRRRRPAPNGADPRRARAARRR